MTSHSSGPAHLAPVAQREFGPLNASVLLSGSVVGTVATLATDVFGTALPAAVPLACAAGWLLAIVLSLTLLGHGAEVSVEASAASKYFACLRYGLRSARAHWRYALVLALMAAMAAYAVYARVRRDEGGVLRAVLQTQGLIRQESEATRASVETLGGKVDAAREASERTLSAAQRTANDVAALRKASEDKTPRERLAALGYKLGPESAVDALSRGDAQVLTLMRAAGVKPIPTSYMSVSGIERLVLDPSADVGATLKAADLHGADLDTPLRPMSLRSGELVIPDIEQLLATQGIETGGFDRMKTPGQTFVLSVAGHGPLLSDVMVTPLLIAVWRGRLDAVKALVAQGASPRAKGMLSLTAYRAEPRKPGEPIDAGNGLNSVGRQEAIEVTPLGETQRLHRGDLEKVLAAAGR